MKFSFSTLGCPDWTWVEITSTAKDLGFDGIEIRGIGSDIYVPDIKVFDDNHVNATREELNKLGLEIPCIASSCYLNLSDKDYLAESKEYITLAEKLGALAVRVLGETDPEPSGNDNDELLIKRLKELCQFAEGKKVFVLLETNGVYASSDRILSIINEVNSEKLGILWDIQHPIRNYNESIEHTWFKLKNYIKHIHMKDSTIENGKIKYKMLGKGDLPIKEVIALLKEENYEHYVSLEWLKRWNSDLEDPGIVFGHYISTIKYMMK